MNPHRIVIVGGGVAATRCAFELRRQGYDGHLQLLSAESTPPYDRTLVSKALIGGRSVLSEQLLLEPPDAYRDAGIELQLGARVDSLDAAASCLTLADGTRVGYDRLVLAVGGEAVRPPRLSADGVVALRTIADARRLSSLLADAERLVIIGGGFIGTEVASSAVARGLDVTLVEAERPFEALLGEPVAKRICALHQRHGVSLITGSPVDSVKNDGDGFEVNLVDGRRLAAEVVVVAVGMRPATTWLGDSALHAPNGVPCDADGRTVLPGVFAAGDCALVRDDGVGGYVTAEHWDVASRHGARVARAILGLPAPPPRPPYFWSDQLGVKLQMVGRTRGADTVHVEQAEGSQPFHARYLSEGRLIGAFAAGAPAAIARARRELERALHERADGSRRAGQPAAAPPILPRPAGQHTYSYPTVVELVRNGTTVRSAHGPARPRSASRGPAAISHSLSSQSQ